MEETQVPEPTSAPEETPEVAPPLAAQLAQVEEMSEEMSEEAALPAEQPLRVSEEVAAVAPAPQTILPEPAVITEPNRELVAAQARIAELEAAHLGAVRRSLLAEHAGEVVPELVRGGTVAELEASVTAAHDAYERIVSDLRAHAAAQVPMGASAGAAPALDDLTPMQKLTHALSRNGRS